MSAGTARPHRRVEAEFSRALPAAVGIRDELRRMLGAGPRSASESVELAQRILGFLQLDGVSIATGRDEQA